MIVMQVQDVSSLTSNDMDLDDFPYARCDGLLIITINDVKVAYIPRRSQLTSINPNTNLPEFVSKSSRA